MKKAGNSEKRPEIWRQVFRRMKNQDGASLMAALLFFVFCGVGASIILASASASAGKIRHLPREDQKRYAVDSAAPFCAVKKNPRTAGSLVRSARRRIRLAPAWYLPKAPAPRTTATAVTARLKFRKTPDPAARQRRKTFQAEKNNDS